MCPVSCVQFLLCGVPNISFSGASGYFCISLFYLTCLFYFKIFGMRYRKLCVCLFRFLSYMTLMSVRKTTSNILLTSFSRRVCALNLDLLSRSPYCRAHAFHLPSTKELLIIKNERGPHMWMTDWLTDWLTEDGCHSVVAIDNVSGQNLCLLLEDGFEHLETTVSFFYSHTLPLTSLPLSILAYSHTHTTTHMCVYTCFRFYWVRLFKGLTFWMREGFLIYVEGPAKGFGGLYHVSLNR
jgi:hypothetical protein